MSAQPESGVRSTGVSGDRRQAGPSMCEQRGPGACHNGGPASASITHTALRPRACRRPPGCALPRQHRGPPRVSTLALTSHLSHLPSRTAKIRCLEVRRHGSVVILGVGARDTLTGSLPVAERDVAAEPTTLEV
jgi:hypothetical protein